MFGLGIKIEPLFPFNGRMKKGHTSVRRHFLPATLKVEESKIHVLYLFRKKLAKKNDHKNHTKSYFRSPTLRAKFNLPTD